MKNRKIISFNLRKKTISPGTKLTLLSRISRARQKFTIIQLNTDGHLFADEYFTRKIVGAGANYFKIFLYGHNAKLHEEISEIEGSFEKTIGGIKNLIKLGQRKNLVLCIVLTELNYKNLFDILDLVCALKINKAELDVAGVSRKRPMVSLHILADYISRARYHYYFDLLVKAKNIPYCLIPEPEILFLKTDSRDEFIRVEKCSTCRYSQICPGILKEYLASFDITKILPTNDVPDEVMIEIEPKCNFDCNFCFNRASFAHEGHHGEGLKKEEAKKMIDGFKEAGVSDVRFTGGEPLLRSDIFELIKYAKEKGLGVKLNTNGSLIKNYKTAEKLAKYLNYILFSMHTYDSQKDEEITGFKGSFQRKVRAIKWLKKAGIKTIRISTIGTRDNLLNLEKFYKLLKELKIDLWAVNRLIPVQAEKEGFNRRNALLLINKVTEIKKDIFKNNISLRLHIINAIPLCAADPIKTNAVALGGRSVDGHTRLVVDPRGFTKPIYYLEKNIGNPLHILDCWNHPFVKDTRNYKFVPDECKQCFLLDKCKGGNRFCAYMAYGKYDAPDPLMNFSRVKNYIW